MKKEKLKAQVKSRFYYYFWGLATLSVVLGQIYVGVGYRYMAECRHPYIRSFESITSLNEFKKVKTTPQNVQESNEALFHRTMNLPKACNTVA